jgi:hypothetical protein
VLTASSSTDPKLFILANLLWFNAWWLVVGCIMRGGFCDLTVCTACRYCWWLRAVGIYCPSTEYVTIRKSEIQNKYLASYVVTICIPQRAQLIGYGQAMSYPWLLAATDSCNNWETLESSNFLVQ